MLRHFFHLGRAYFELDHRQAKAYLWLLFFTAAIVCSPLFTYYLYPAPYDVGDVRLILQEAELKDSLSVSLSSNKSVALFHKRMDEMKQEDWIAAGLPAYLSKRILKYQSKVKRLRKVNDLYAIYGMDSSRVIQVKPYLIELEVSRPPITIKKQQPSLIVLDINTADSVALEALPAIGTVLSKRILKYRELLKGYASKKQYAEIYGITPEALTVLQKWTEIKAVPIVSSIKTADYQKLNGHFYLSGKDARFILGQLKIKSTCWEELQPGLEPKAQEHIEELKLYYPCE
ncbi:MAG: transporter [Chitinophagaceae bacterium]|nr:transporter [Chitinophagaceae bacterium]